MATRQKTGAFLNGRNALFPACEGKYMVICSSNFNLAQCLDEGFKKLRDRLLASRGVISREKPGQSERRANT